MDFWYYWENDLPKKTGLNQYPADYYESLLSPNDRFSFIYDDYEALLGLLNGETLESGFEFKLYFESTLFPEAESSTNVVMQLTYVKPSNALENSPAAELGLQRGDILYAINGTQFTEANYRTLLDQMGTTYEASYRRYNATLEEFEDQAPVNITPVVFPENPIYLSKVLETGGKKVGYLVYNFFSPGEDNVYDNAVDAAFAEFKSAGIDELIVDLRFNGGGSVASAINLASLIAEGVTTNDVVLRRSYNTRVTQAILGDPDLGADFLVDHFDSKSQNVGSMLSGKVYFIVTDRTASASEMVINSVRPFMDVYLVGETTVGKDVGSITIPDQDNPRNDWAIQPIVVKLVNRDNQDYPSGFAPDVALPDDFQVLQPLGDENEPLLGAALAAIGVVPVRTDQLRKPMYRKPIFESIDRKKWNQKILLSATDLKPTLDRE
jgi:C-terminal processing protease CtpA/Prc